MAKDIKVTDPSKGLYHDTEERIVALISQIKESLDKQEVMISRILARMG